MAWSRQYTGSDNSDREDFYNDRDKLETTHVDRYDLGGNYKYTDVYNGYGEKIDRFDKEG